MFCSDFDLGATIQICKRIPQFGASSGNYQPAYWRYFPLLHPLCHPVCSLRHLFLGFVWRTTINKFTECRGLVCNLSHCNYDVQDESHR